MHTILVLIHVAAGTIALIAGAVAIFSRKGSSPHRKFGTVFVITMLVMASLGGFGALYKPEMISTLNGILTCYLIVSAWLTVKRGENEIGLPEIAALLVALGVGTAHVVAGLEAANDATGLKDDFPAIAYYTFGSVALIAAALDASMIFRGGVSGKHRIARHLWRMCFALFIAVTSLFLGQPQVFPEAIRGSLVLAVPTILVIVLTLFWLGRVLFTKWYENA